MTLLTENNGWGIVWMNNRYYVRHLLCGAYFRYRPETGCNCHLPKSPIHPVDDMILMKFKLLTKGDNR